MEGCTLLHMLHFSRFARWMARTGYSPGRPYVITNGGTDINHRLSESNDAEPMKRFIRDAEAVVVFTEDGKRKCNAVPGLAPEKVHVNPQSVWFPESTNRHRLEDAPRGYPKCLLPAGLRPVKDVLFLLNALEDLQGAYERMQFVIVGSVLDEGVYEQVLEAERRYHWFHFAGEVPFEKMWAWYDWADIVLNTSISEGQSSALLEAMGLGKLVMARTNPGNESVVSDGHTGFLYRDGTEFL